MAENALQLKLQKYDVQPIQAHYPVGLCHRVQHHPGKVLRDRGPLLLEHSGRRRRMRVCVVGHDIVHRDRVHMTSANVSEVFTPLTLSAVRNNDRSSQHPFLLPAFGAPHHLYHNRRHT